MKIISLTAIVFTSLCATSACIEAQSNYDAYDFRTLAGLRPGSADGIGRAARFNGPSGVAVDSSGNVYIADTHNHTIRKITPARVVSTVAGLAGSSGSADGTGSGARFSEPRGVAVDSAHNVYVTDSGNCTIRKITPAGVVSTFAGLAGSCGSADGTGSAARFNFLVGMAVDNADNLYIADSGNYTIRKITSAGVVSTLAGLARTSGSADGIGSAARFFAPEGVAVDSSGNVYVADTFNYTIRKITPARVVSTVAGLAGSNGSADGTGSAARFYLPEGVAVDSAGNVYVADFFNWTIRKITPARVVSTVAGLPGSNGSADGTGSAARFYGPYGMAMASSGNVYVADWYNHTIRKVTPGGVVTTFAGLASPGSADGTGGAARFNSPSGVAIDGAGNAYVGEFLNHTIRKITPAGTVSTLAGLAGSAGSTDGTGSAARFANPAGVAVDSAGNVYVADWSNGTIRKITPAGVVSTLAGLAGSFGSADGTGSAARFYGPLDVAVDSAGNVYVADTDNYTIRKITPARVVSTLAGFAGSLGSVDGTGSAARFSFPEGVAADSAGNVYVADSGNDTIRKITPARMVSTLAGLAGSQGSADGTGSAARFLFPTGVAADTAGNVYVADSGNSTIRKITPARVVSTLAGLARSPGTADGTGSAARFSGAGGIAVDRVRNVYVTDSNSIRIGRYVATNPATYIASFSATLNGSLNPHGLPTTIHFQYGTTTGYGLATAPEIQNGNTYRNVSADISSLNTNTTYHFRIVASNSAGTVYGADRTFATLSATGPPVVTTNLATNRTTSSATLNGLLDPHGLTTKVSFQYGSTTSYGRTTPMQSNTGNTFRDVAANISGLTTHTTYHFRMTATNSAGTRYGSDRTFTTF